MTQPNRQTTHPGAALNASLDRINKAQPDQSPESVSIDRVQEITHSLAQGISGGVRYNRDQLAMANERIANLEQCINRSLLMCYDVMGIPTAQQEGRDE